MPPLFDKKLCMARMTIGSPYAPHDIGTINLEKGRWIEPAALKHGSAVGCAAAGSCFHAVTGIAEVIGGRSPERNSPTS